MTHQEFEERLDEALQNLGLKIYEQKLYDPSAEWDGAKNAAKQAIDRLFLDAVGEDDIADLVVAAKILHPRKKAAYRRGLEIRNELRQELRTTITGKEGGDE